MYSHSLLLTAQRHLEWVREELPSLQSHEVLIQTTAGAISTGSELLQYCGTARSSEPARYPRMTGYESVGIVIDRGSAVQRLQVGNRVVALYGHRTYDITPETKAIAIPDEVPDALALLAILSCDVTKGIRKVTPKPEEPALITGAGTIGLLTTSMLKAYGAQTIDVIEPRSERRTMALQLGASTALLPQEMASRSNNYAVAFECSSRNLAFELLQRRMQHEGRICILSDGNVEPLFLTPAVTG